MVERRRPIWGPIFLVAGVLGLVAIAWAALDPVIGLPIAVALWALTAYAGYRIWRAAHPAASAWRELGRRGQAVAGGIATLAAVSFVQAFPQLVVGILGVWLVAIVALVIAVVVAERGVKQ